MRTQTISSKGGFIWMRVPDTGLDRLQNKLDRMYGDMDEELAEEMVDELYKIKEESEDLVPVDTGLLKSTAAVTFRKLAGGALAGEVSYSTPYAVFVHEDPFARHAPGTQWKFLEEAWNRRRGGILRALERRIQRIVRSAS